MGSIGCRSSDDPDLSVEVKSTQTNSYKTKYCYRFVRVLRLYFEHRNLVKGVRQRISENKRRFQVVSLLVNHHSFQVDGYDLDLTYVTTNIIAMSFPSKGTVQTKNKIVYDPKLIFRKQGCVQK